MDKAELQHKFYELKEKQTKICTKRPIGIYLKYPLIVYELDS